MVNTYFHIRRFTPRAVILSNGKMLPQSQIRIESGIVTGIVDWLHMREFRNGVTSDSVVTRPQTATVKSWESRLPANYFDSIKVNRVSNPPAYTPKSFFGLPATVSLSERSPFVPPANVTPYGDPFVPRVVNPDLTVGAYKLNGETFVLRMSRKNRRGERHMYALHMVEISGNRLTESNEVKKIKFVFDQLAKDVLYTLMPGDKLSVEDQIAITIRYGRCLICSRGLKDATSVARGIGPVCFKAMSSR